MGVSVGRVSVIVVIMMLMHVVIWGTCVTLVVIVRVLIRMISMRLRLRWGVTNPY